MPDLKLSPVPAPARTEVSRCRSRGHGTRRLCEERRVPKRAIASLTSRVLYENQTSWESQSPKTSQPCKPGRRNSTLFLGPHPAFAYCVEMSWNFQLGPGSPVQRLRGWQPSPVMTSPDCPLGQQKCLGLCQSQRGGRRDREGGKQEHHSPRDGRFPRGQPPHKK